MPADSSECLEIPVTTRFCIFGEAGFSAIAKNTRKPEYSASLTGHGSYRDESSTSQEFYRVTFYKIAEHYFDAWIRQLIENSS